MEANLGARVHELVELGWEPLATTETTAALVGRRPFNWWLFVFVLFFFPVFGGVLYLVFHLAMSRATVFLHVESDGVVTAGDTWLVAWQQAQRDAHVERQKKIKERGFLAVMWPQLLVSLALVAGWLVLLKWYFGSAA
ncbi:MAG TPA: hypothetical protein VLT32_09760 [Candidatus Sulfomarinibacteraceae bacterium]|nr:hypothetical protein [Candidatus Sulfomarinibacteraceae bacterium]